MEWTFPASGPCSADLDLPAGSVRIDLDATDEVRVLLEPLEHGGNSAREQIENAEVTWDGSRLYVRVPKRKLHDVNLLLSVLVPTRSSLRVRTASADVSCKGIVGPFEAKTASGDVTVRDECDSVHVSTASGDVRMAKVLGEAELQTASGDVSLTSVGGRTSVTTASGDSRIGAVAHDARFRTASGDVTVGCAFEGDLSVTSASGDVRIGVGPGVGTWLDLVTMSGESSCSLPADVEGESGATLRISCRTMSGDIEVHAGTAPSDGEPRRSPSGGPSSGGPSTGPGLPGGPGAGGAFPGAGSGSGAGGAFPGGSGFPDLSGLPGTSHLSGLADLADLADLASLADFADTGDQGAAARFGLLGEMVSRPLTGRVSRLPWRKA
jgi:hypothetical protein